MFIGLQFETSIAALANLTAVSLTLCSRRLFAILARTLVGEALGLIRAQMPASIATVASVSSVARTARARAPNTVETDTLVDYVTATMKVMHECMV